MRERYIFSYFFRLFVVALLAIAAGAEVSENEARELARNSTQSRTGAKVWSVHRREDIEEQFHLLGPTRKDGGLFVFLLSDQGYEFQDRAVHVHLPSEGPMFWYVAVSTSSAQVYRLSGFKDSREEFNKLVTFLGIGIWDDLQASEYLDLYLELDPDRQTLVLPRTPLQLKQAAETEFTRAYDDFGTAESAFDRWWKQNSKVLSQVSLSETFTKTDKGFLAKFCIVSSISKKDISKGPALLEVSLPISNEGQAGELKFSPKRLSQ